MSDSGSEASSDHHICTYVDHHPRQLFCPTRLFFMNISLLILKWEWNGTAMKHFLSLILHPHLSGPESRSLPGLCGGVPGPVVVVQRQCQCCGGGGGSVTDLGLSMWHCLLHSVQFSSVQFDSVYFASAVRCCCSPISRHSAFGGKVLSLFSYLCWLCCELR